MRRFLAVLLLVVLLIGGSVTAFAAQKWTKPPNLTITDGVGHVGILKTSLCTEPQKAFLREWLASDKRLLYVRSFHEQYREVNYVFVILDGYSKASDIEVVGSSFRINCSYRSVTFGGLSPFTGSDGIFFGSSLVLNGTSDSMTSVLFYDGYESPSLNDWEIPMDHLEIEDDDGLFVVEEPDPPSSSSTPELPPLPSAPDIPVIPSITNEYIPYDTTRWNGFLQWVVSSLGNATNVGFVIFGIILSILVVIRVVKYFTK